MLISRRKEGDSLQIGDEVEIRVVSIQKNKVTLGIVAPRKFKITTRKLSEMEMANTAAAAHSAHVGQLLGSPLNPAENILFVLDPDSLAIKPESADKENGRSDE